MDKIVLIISALIAILPMTNCQAQTEAAINPALGAYQGINMQDIRASIGLSFLDTINDSVMEEGAESPADKAGLGVLNAATSWTDVPRQIAKNTQQYNILMAATVGLGEGIITGVARGVSGAFDVATFAVGPYNSTMKPAYTAKNSKDGFKVNLINW